MKSDSVWPLRSLGELTVNHDRKRVPVRSQDRRPGPYPYYGASGVVDWVDQYLFEGRHLLVAEDGENLRSRKTPVAFLASGRFWVNNHAHVVTGASERADTRFLAYALACTDISAYVSGSAQPKLSQRALSSIELAAPPLEEQRWIAGVLGALDDKIEHNRTLASRLLVAAAAHVDRVLRSATDVTSIYDVAAVTYGRAFKSENFGSTGTPLLRIRDLATHKPGIRTTEKLPRARLVTLGDVVVGMDGEFRAHLWHGPDSLLNQRVCVFDPKLGVSRAYLWRAVQAPLAFIEGTEAGTTVIHLGKADIDEFELPMMSDEEMLGLVESVDPMTSMAVHLGREVRVLTAIRDALLPKLVSGRIRVPEGYVPA